MTIEPPQFSDENQDSSDLSALAFIAQCVAVYRDLGLEKSSNVDDVTQLYHNIAEYLDPEIIEDNASIYPAFIELALGNSATINTKKASLEAVIEGCKFICHAFFGETTDVTIDEMTNDNGLIDLNVILTRNQDRYVIKTTVPSDQNWDVLQYWYQFLEQLNSIEKRHIREMIGISDDDVVFIFLPKNADPNHLKELLSFEAQYLPDWARTRALDFDEMRPAFQSESVVSLSENQSQRSTSTYKNILASLIDENGQALPWQRWVTYLVLISLALCAAILGWV